MLKLIASIVFVVNFATLSVAQLRVIGGKPARNGQFPYQVSLQYIRTSSHFCGGSIIAPDVILTAAHCLKRKVPRTIKVVAGTNLKNVGGIPVGVREYFIHSKYNSTTKDNDVAILKLENNLPIGSNFKIQIIKLVDGNATLVEGDLATVSGWGRNKPLDGKPYPPSPTHLQYATLSVWDHKRCARNVPFKITENMICAKSSDRRADTCEGDSGGPLVVNGKLAGIVSFGLKCELPNPGVYTKVAALRSWIREFSGV